MSLSWFQNSRKGGHLKFPRPLPAWQAPFLCSPDVEENQSRFFSLGLFCVFNAHLLKLHPVMSVTRGLFFFFSLHTCPIGLLVICCEYDVIYSLRICVYLPDHVVLGSELICKDKALQDSGAWDVNALLLFRKAADFFQRHIQPDNLDKYVHKGKPQRTFAQYIQPVREWRMNKNAKLLIELDSCCTLP